VAAAGLLVDPATDRRTAAQAAGHGGLGMAQMNDNDTALIRGNDTSGMTPPTRPGT
jgi:hypothetical protein